MIISRRLLLVALLSFASLASAQDNRPEFVIVTIGDSYASGEGNPERQGTHAAPQFTPQPAETWSVQPGPRGSREDTRCHRSPLAASSLAARELAARYPEIRISFVSFACSGATIDEGLIGPYSGAESSLAHLTPLPSQLDQINGFFGDRPNKKIDALIISVGGNDIGFGPIVAACLLAHLREFPGGCHEWVSPVYLFAKMTLLGRRYRELDAAINGRVAQNELSIRAASRPSRVYITEYPNPAQAGRAGTGPASNPDNLCDGTQTNDPVYDNLNRDESYFVRERVVGVLNARLANAASSASPQWRVVTGIYGDFEAHGICSSATWFRTNADGLRQQGDDAKKIYMFDGRQVVFSIPVSAGVAHPNELGHRAIAKRLVEAIEPQIRERFGSTVVSVPAPHLRLAGISSGVQLTATQPTVQVQRTAVGASPERIAATTVSWSDPLGGGAQRFVLEVNGQRRELSGTTTTYTHAQPGLSRFRVQVCGRLACSPFSPEVRISNMVPGTPSSLGRSTSPGTQVHAGTIPLIWTAADQHAEYYEVQYRSTPSTLVGLRGETVATSEVRVGSRTPASSAYLVLRTPETSVRLGSLIEPLPGAESYDVRVRACSSAGCSAFTPVLTEPLRVPAPPPLPAREEE